VLQQERLRALGQMASGIAHDINNTISPVSLYVESLLGHESGLSDRARQYLTIILTAVEDVAQTVSRMREFYRPREPQLSLTRVDLNTLVQQVIDLTRSRWSDVPLQRGVSIDVQTELLGDLPTIVGSGGEIRDALTNLVFNAIDAMPEGGTLTLQTSVVLPNQSDGDLSSHVCVEVRDTGVGMDDDTRRRCIEPFFTTKGERGSGLGLSSVYGVAQRHTGQLQIDSERGRGTAVRLNFPLSTDEPTSGGGGRQLPARAPTQGLRILVVDDDPVIITSLQKALNDEGHFVTTAQGGQAGIDAFAAAREQGDPFAVVITDLGMPYVDGRKVAAAIRATSSTPIILLTGWGHSLIAEKDVPAGVDRVLSKPPRLTDLRVTLAELTQSVAPLTVS
jgi:CheY-like chemotaxis protein/anti-sigma regulatory factor (Ser/Thr protein kinase)